MQNKVEFIYDSFSPSPYCVPQRNKVTVWNEKGKIHFSRQYISKDGEESRGINHIFENNPTNIEIAEMIHWGCSGTSINSFQLADLIEKIKPVIVK